MAVAPKTADYLTNQRASQWRRDQSGGADELDGGRVEALIETERARRLPPGGAEVWT